MFVTNQEIWVIDTSSLIHVKELIGPKHRSFVFEKLTELCDEGRLLFPPEVVDELKNGVKPGRPDPPLSWVKANKQPGCRLGRCHDQLVKVMNDPVAQLTPDPDQTSGEDDADPHVLATALKVHSLGRSLHCRNARVKKIASPSTSQCCRWLARPPVHQLICPPYRNWNLDGRYLKPLNGRMRHTTLILNPTEIQNRNDASRMLMRIL